MLLTRGETDKLLQRIRDDQPGLVEELVPTVVSVSDIQKILQNLLREKVLVRHLEAILETLADAGRNSKDLGYLVVGPKFADQLLARLASQADRMMKANMRPVLLCAPDLRRHVRALCERVLPPMRVLSMAEVPNSVNLKAYTTVSL
jgi:flagellar biosynthesis protein FlhA